MSFSNTDHSKFYAKCIEYWEKGYTNKTSIAEKVIAEMDYNLTIEAGRRLFSKHLSKHQIKQDNPALLEEAEKVGIDVGDVRQAWYKGKNWSIQFSPKKEGVTFEQMLKDHIESVEKHTFNYDIVRTKNNNGDCHLLVVDPADIHVGKLARAFETGEEYNSEIAIQRVHDGVAGILEKAEGFNIDKILFVAGNDVLHIDTPDRRTRNGTPQDTDGMWYDNFLKAKEMYVTVIDRLLLKADVHFMFNPSNHDYTNGFFLADSITSWYRNCKNITFDTSIAHRKYYRYHDNLIGTTHGDGAKSVDLPILMATESKEDWAKVKHRYIYTHHVHHKTAKDHPGVTIESLRSPSGADSWHHIKGHQHAVRAIEGFLHHKNHGQIARLTHIFY
jgi:hypothetical protein